MGEPGGAQGDGYRAGDAGEVNVGRVLELAADRWPDLALVTDEAGRAGYDLLEIPSLLRRPFLRQRGGPEAERTGPFAFIAASRVAARRSSYVT